MKKLLLILVPVFLFTLVSCGSKETVQETKQQQQVVQKDEQKEAELKKQKEEEEKAAALAAAAKKKAEEEKKWAEDSNAKLEKVPVAGFAYRAMNLDKAILDKWVKSNIALIQDIIKSMPEGYVLEIKGHASSVDPKIKPAKGEKPINLQEISEARAKLVYDLFIANGIDKAKLTFLGVADKELLNKDNPTAAENRRVSFSVIKK